MVRTLNTLVLLLLPYVSVAEVEKKLEAKAFSLNERQLLFKEDRTRIYLNGDLIRTSVSYTGDKGNLVAQKQLNYSNYRYCPQLDLLQSSIGYHLKAVPKNDSLYIELTEDNETKRKSIPLPKNPVLDEGIHILVKDNLEKIKKGEKIEFDLLLPERFTSVKFEVSKLEDKNGDSNILYMEMKPANFLLAMLVGDIQFEYGLSEKELITYRGISDIKNSKGKNHKVFMKFKS